MGQDYVYKLAESVRKLYPDVKDDYLFELEVSHVIPYQLGSLGDQWLTFRPLSSVSRIHDVSLDKVVDYLHPARIHQPEIDAK